MPSSKSRGLYRKYEVSRVDRRDHPGGDRADAEYFVLDLVHDPMARVALGRYAMEADRNGFHKLADDLREKLHFLEYNRPDDPPEGSGGAGDREPRVPIQPAGNGGAEVAHVQEYSL